MSVQTTVWVSIGNSDNKLSQRTWSAFCHSVNSLINSSPCAVFAETYSLPNAKYQNAHGGFNLTPTSQPEMMKRELARIAHLYEQDSIAWLEGETFFLQGV